MFLLNLGHPSPRTRSTQRHRRPRLWFGTRTRWCPPTWPVMEALHRWRPRQPLWQSSRLLRLESAQSEKQMTLGADQRWQDILRINRVRRHRRGPRQSLCRSRSDWHELGTNHQHQHHHCQRRRRQQQQQQQRRHVQGGVAPRMMVVVVARRRAEARNWSAFATSSSLIDEPFRCAGVK